METSNQLQLGNKNGLSAKDTVNQLWESKFEKSISIKNKRLLKKQLSPHFFEKKTTKSNQTPTNHHGWKKIHLTKKKTCFSPSEDKNSGAPTGPNGQEAPHIQLLSRWSPRPVEKKSSKSLKSVWGVFFVTLFLLGHPPKSQVGDK